MEEFIDGTFVKYINNNGQSCVDEEDLIGRKAACFSRFTYEQSKGKLIVLDIQGSNQSLRPRNCFLTSGTR